MGESVNANNNSSVFYTPIRQKSVAASRIEGERGVESIFVSCWVPFFSNYKASLEKSIVLRRLIDIMEYFAYMLRIRLRLPSDKVDGCVILHLWDSTVCLLSPLISKLKPTAILYMGHSLRWLSRFKLQYPLIVLGYKIALGNAYVLVNDDVEQKDSIYNVIKKPENKVFLANPCIVDDILFRPLDRIVSCKKVGFDPQKFNIVIMSRIIQWETISKNKTWDYEKNIFSLLEIFRYLVKANNRIVIHIIGAGEGMNQLEMKIKQYSLENNILLHGFQAPTNDENDVRPYFINASDLVMNPSCLNEFNIEQALFEALLCSKTVAAFKRYKAVAIEHKGGFLIDQEPSLGTEEIISRINPEYLQQKSLEARYVASNQNVPFELWGKNLIKIFNKIKENQE